MTTDTSFIDNPPSSRAQTKFTTPAPMRARPSSGFIKRGGEEGGGPARGSKGGAARRGGLRGVGKSGIARGKPKDAR